MGMIISYAASHIIEAIILWISMSQMYSHRFRQWITGLAIFAGHAVMFGVFCTCNIYVVTLVNIVTYIVLIALLYDISIGYTVFWAIILNTVIALSEQIVIFILRYAAGVNYIELNNIVSCAMVVCLCKVVYFIITQIMVRIQNRRKSSAGSDLSMLLLMVTLIASLTVFVTLYLIADEYDINGKDSAWAVMSSVLLIFANILVLWVNIRISDRNAENARMKLQLEQERADTKYYKLAYEKNESLEILRHDISNHLNTLLDMGSDEDVKKYIMGIMKDYSIGRRTTFSKSNVLNGLVNQYMEQCQNEGIELLVDIRLGTVENIAATDVVALFGNVLSNAYEAVMQCSKDIYPYIELVVKRSGDIIIIKESNSCAAAPKMSGGQLISVKKDTQKKHGYGMKSIDKVVEKYNGSHMEEYDEENREFSISIILMLETGDCT